jgi:hypothetical protein
MGKLGFRGRTASPEEQAKTLDAFFFGGARRIPYLQQYFVLMLLSAAIRIQLPEENADIDPVPTGAGGASARSRRGFEHTEMVGARDLAPTLSRYS